jgi:type III pantothenate kinase
MIVVFDVGNSEITIGIFDGEELVSHWRVTTAAQRTADELAILIRSITGEALSSAHGTTGSAICSVVPAITPMLAEACEMCFGRKPVMIDARAKLPVKLDVEEPFTVGADRISARLRPTTALRRTGPFWAE